MSLLSLITPFKQSLPFGFGLLSMEFHSFSILLLTVSFKVIILIWLNILLNVFSYEHTQREIISKLLSNFQPANFGYFPNLGYHVSIKKPVLFFLIKLE